MILRFHWSIIRYLQRRQLFICLVFKSAL